MKLKTLLITISVPALTAMSIVPIVATACSNNLVWDFNQNNFALYDNKVTPIPNGSYDTLSIGKKYNKNFVKNFCVDFRHYIQDTINELSYSKIVSKMTYNAQVFEHKFDAKKGLIKDFSCDVQVELSISGEYFYANLGVEIHNYFLMGAFTPANIFLDLDPYNWSPVQAHIDGYTEKPLTGNYLSFAPQYDAAGYTKKQSLFGYSCASNIFDKFHVGAQSYFNQHIISPLEKGTKPPDVGLYIGSYVLNGINKIKPVSLSLPQNVRLTNQLIDKGMGVDSADLFCTVINNADNQWRYGAWFAPINEDENIYLRPIDIRNRQWFSAYLDCLPSNMQSFKINGKQLPFSQIVTNIDLLAYVGAGESSPAVWNNTNKTFEHLFLHLAVNPCFSLGNVAGVPDGYITAAGAQQNIMAELVQPNGLCEQWWIPS